MSVLRILPLAFTPRESKQIVDWRPFGNGTLGEIVNQFNVKCRQTHENMGWSPDDIKTLVDKIDIVRHDLNEVGKLSTDDFETIVILLADRDQAHIKQKELGFVRNYMGRWKKPYYLIQVSKKSDAPSLTIFFAGLPIYPYPKLPPQLLFKQQEFEWFLMTYFCFTGCPPNGEEEYKQAENDDNGDGDGYDGDGDDGKEYADLIAKVKAEVRHVAIERNMSKRETTALAYLAVQQELALRNVSRLIQEQPHERVVLNAIRKPVLQIANQPFQRPKIRPVELLQIRPTRPLEMLSGQQRSILKNMGIKNETYTFVTENTPMIQNLVIKLGNSVDVGRLSARLPVFKPKF